MYVCELGYSKILERESTMISNSSCHERRVLLQNEVRCATAEDVCLLQMLPDEPTVITDACGQIVNDVPLYQSPYLC